MQRSSALPAHARPARGAHSVVKPAGPRIKHHHGSHSRKKTGVAAKGVAFGSAIALAACIATPAAIQGFTAQAEPLGIFNPTGIENSADGAVSEADALAMQNVMEREQQAERIEKLGSKTFYLAQSRSGRCTLASATMIMKRAAYLNQNENWRAIGEKSVEKDAWTAGGLKNSFKSFGMKVQLKQFKNKGSNKKTELIALLGKHPEGISVYDSTLPHAIVVTGYDAENDTFYCADPAPSYAKKQLKMSKTWNGTCRKGQKSAIEHLTSYWAVNS